MTSEDESGKSRPKQAPWSVVVVYEDTHTREQAVQLCDTLVGALWGEHGLDVSWWSFASLQQPLAASEATAKAIAADLIVFATQPGGDLPMTVRAWVETWVEQRGEREGALFGLVEASSSSTVAATDKFVYLRSTAHRAGLDYLTRIPQNTWLSVPNSLDSYSERADQMTDVLAEILRQRPPPPSLPH